MSNLRQLLSLLEKNGLLLQQDPTLPSVVTMVAGEVLASSWWTHPRAHAIFRCLSEMADHPDTLVCKLIGGKVTFLHRRLWTALLATAQARAPWQFKKLSAAARLLFDQVEREGSLIASGPPAKALEQRLLVHGHQEHTESGAHKTCLETWQKWSRRTGCRTKLSVSEGQKQLEDAVRQIGGTVDLLPWHRYG